MIHYRFLVKTGVTDGKDSQGLLPTLMFGQKLRRQGQDRRGRSQTFKLLHAFRRANRHRHPGFHINENDLIIHAERQAFFSEIS